MTARWRMFEAANRCLTILGCVLLGCGAPSRSARAASLAETAPRSERSPRSESTSRSEKPAPLEGETVPRRTEAAAWPALHDHDHDHECGVDAGAPEWLGSSSSPKTGWWKAFSDRHPSRTKPIARGGWAPIADLQIFGMDASSSVLRAQQSLAAGEYKLCYREALYKDLALPGSASRPPLQGDWVARFTLRRDRICALEVLETSLPSEVSDCLRSSALRQVHAGLEEGQFELVLVFRVPYALPPPSRNQGSPITPAIQTKIPQNEDR